MIDQIDTLVIGAGQAGLATSGSDVTGLGIPVKLC